MSRTAGRVSRSLVLHFAVVSAVLVAALGLVLTTWQGEVIRSSNIAAAKDTATYSMGLTMGEIGVKASGPVAITAAQYQRVTTLLGSMVATGKYLGATAWSEKGLVAYAVEPGRTGRVERPRTQVLQAFKGKPVYALVHSTQPGVPDPTERSALSDTGAILEVFVPVRLGGKVLAVVEFYQPWQPVETTIARQTRQVFALFGGGLLVLWAGLLGFVVTASRRLRVQSDLNLELASHDSLTGLPNRKLLAELGERALQSSDRSLGVLLIDLDDFKAVNDTLGHHCGDLLLQQAAIRLTESVRPGDVVARLGGDEFVVLLPELSSWGEALLVAQRIVVALARRFVIDGVSLDIEGSIGVAVSPLHGTDMETLLRHADSGMYQAKSTKTAVAIYSPEADTRTPHRLGRLGELRTAIADPSQLVIHYQPKAAVITGELRGVEALVRWQHPVEGLLLPGEFIPLAEQTGLIHPLTIAILTKALTQAQMWDAAGLELPVAVNVSARNLLDADFPEMVGRLLDEHHVNPRNLELEITESAIMADPKKAISVLTRLRSLGVVLTIDDFGTGHSSMTRLKTLPVHQLKIDQSFITNMTAGSADAAIVRSCIDLGRNLGLTVVAEGVETADVWNQLIELGCDQAQGYFLGVPMPAATLWGWIEQRGELGTTVILT